MAILVGASFVVNLRILQIGSAIPPHRLQPLYRFIWIGFAINLLSGLVLFVTEAADRVRRSDLLRQDGQHRARAVVRHVDQACGHRSARRPASDDGARALIGYASLGLWVVAIVAGRLMAYFNRRCRSSPPG